MNLLLFKKLEKLPDFGSKYFQPFPNALLCLLKLVNRLLWVASGTQYRSDRHPSGKRDLGIKPASDWNLRDIGHPKRKTIQFPEGALPPGLP